MPRTYFEQRMGQLGCTPELNTMRVRLYDYELEEHTEKTVDAPIFEEDRHGNIVINVWRLDRTQIIVDNPKARPEKDDLNNQRAFPFAIKRLKEPDGDRKYHIPKGAGSWPFFPPELVNKYELGEQIDTLVLTEGYFKAWKAQLHGIDCVGLSSIWHFRDKKKKLYEDVAALIRRCNVNKIVILHDADCRNLGKNAIEKEDENIEKRVKNFYEAASQMQDTLRDIAGEVNANIYYAHIKEDISFSYPSSKFKCRTMEEDGEPKETLFEFSGLSFMHGPKGLDDLLIAASGEEAAIVKDLNTWSPMEGAYFNKMNISLNSAKLRTYFNLRNAETFYSYYSQYLQGRKFRYNGTTYEYDEEKQKLNVVVPAEARLYARIGIDYFKKVSIPDKYGTVNTELRGWTKGTIIDDHGKQVAEKINKYEAFCNVPDHKNYQQSVNNCYNLYSEFEWDAEKGDITASLSFIKHIFGTEPMEYNGKTFQSYELGLDYMQLLYQKPTQVLPILVLTSTERGTGKTTFGNWLKQIYKANAVWVNNEDWGNTFNGPFLGKLIAMTEEALLEKKFMYEKVKAMSTQDKIMANRKGKEQVELDWFGKLIFFTNNEFNFMPIPKEENRFWVRKIPVLEDADPFFIKNLIEEIPAFLYFLENRKMATDNVTRQWFDFELTKTEALDSLVSHSMPRAEKQIRDGIRDMFLDFGIKDEILLTVKDVNQLFLNNRYASDLQYPRHLLVDNLGLEQFRNGQGKFTVKAYSYPIAVEVDGAEQTKWIRKKGRPYVFTRKQFVSEEDEANNEMDSTTAAEMEQARAEHEQREADFEAQNAPVVKQDDLPF